MSISGKRLGVLVGGVEVAGNYAWTADEGADVLDRTTGADAGFEREDLGVYNCHVTMKLYLDITDGQYANLQRGAELSNLELYRSLEDTVPAFLIPEAIVVHSTQGGEVRGRIEVTVEAHSMGEYESNDP